MCSHLGARAIQCDLKSSNDKTWWARSPPARRAIRISACEIRVAKIQRVFRYIKIPLT